jgi:hypothetical protein
MKKETFFAIHPFVREFFNMQVSLVESILHEAHFKGVFNIEDLPDFSKSHQATYIITVDPIVCFAVAVYSRHHAVVFNCSQEHVAIPPELIHNLSQFYNVSLINANIAILVKHMLGICIYFLYHCHSSLCAFDISFPMSAVKFDHYLNIHDFLKVKSPINFNVW